MEHKLNLCVNARLLRSDSEALRRVSQILAELEEEGFLKDGILTFEDSKKGEVEGIFNKNLIG